MSRHVVVTLEPDRVIVRGYKGGELAAEAGCRAIWLGTVKGWVLDRHRADDLLAYLDHRHVAVRLVEVGGVP